MAMAIGSVFNVKATCVSKSNNKRNRRSKFCCSLSLTDEYRTLRIQPGVSESEVKKAFRRLALQYHPDVCKGKNSGVQFHQNNEAYDKLMSNLREKETSGLYETSDASYVDNGDDAMYDPNYDMWDEWMGWEGAGIRDYSSHVNPYI